MLTEWVMSIAAVFLVATVGYALKNERATAELGTAVVAIKENIGGVEERVGKVENRQDELQKQVTEIVSKGVEAGVSQSLQKILDAIEENRSGAYIPARNDNITGHD